MASCCLETNEHLPPRLEQSQAFCSACSPLSNPGLAFPLQAGRKRILNLKDFYARGLTEGEGGFKATDEFTATNAALYLLPAHSRPEIPLSYDSPPQHPYPSPNQFE